MAEPCERCGSLHEASSPCPPPTESEPEACAFCGERHPAGVSCARWAQQGGSALATVYAGVASGERSTPVIVPRKPRRTAGNAQTAERLALRIGVGVLALIGIVALARAAAGPFVGGSSGTSAALPACSLSRIRANLTTAAAIESEAGAVLQSRVGSTNALQLAPSADCDAQVYLLYSSYLDDAALCLTLASPPSCQARDAVHAQLNQALSSGQ